MPTLTRIILLCAAVAVAVIAAIWFTFPADAAPVCGPFKTVLTNLKERYGESPAYVGEAAGGMVLTIAVNPETGTWTALMQPNAETMCVMSAGKGWMAAPDSLANPPQPVPQMWIMPGGRFLLPAVIRPP